MRKILIFICLILSFSSVFANQQKILNPVDMLNQNMVVTQNKIIKNTDKYKKNPHLLFKLLHSKIAPLMASNIIAQLVIGSEKWKNATKAEQQSFVKLATEMMILLYESNVANSGAYKIVLYPFTDNSWKNKNVIIVNGKIINTINNSSSDLSINLFKNKKTSKWMIYNFNIAGVGILQTYQQQFAKYKSVIEANKAMQKIINKMKKKGF